MDLDDLIKYFREKLRLPVIKSDLSALDKNNNGKCNLEDWLGFNLKQPMGIEL